MARGSSCCVDAKLLSHFMPASVGCTPRLSVLRGGTPRDRLHPYPHVAHMCSPAPCHDHRVVAPHRSRGGNCCVGRGAARGDAVGCARRYRPAIGTGAPNGAVCGVRAGDGLCCWTWRGVGTPTGGCVCVGECVSSWVWNRSLGGSSEAALIVATDILPWVLRAGVIGA